MPPNLLSSDIHRWRVWALVNLGLPRAEFDLLTPAEFLDYVVEWKKRERARRFGLAQVCYVVASSMGAKPRGAHKLSPEFFLGEAPLKQPRKKKRYSSNELKQQFLHATQNLQHINK